MFCTITPIKHFILFPQELDGDAVRLTNPMGKAAARDIVQFVPFNNFAKAGLDSHLSRLHLAREVLAEVPDQFVSFMKSREEDACRLCLVL